MYIYIYNIYDIWSETEQVLAKIGQTRIESTQKVLVCWKSRTSTCKLQLESVFNQNEERLFRLHVLR